MPFTVKISMEKGAEDLFPAKAHPGDAAWDLRSRVDTELPVGRSTAVPTGVRMELPENFEAQIRPRSGLALKYDLMLTNSPGTIDAGFRGEVAVIMYNGGSAPYRIRRGDRIAQMVICRLPEVLLERTGELTESDRGTGGFGSTGKN